MSDELREHQPDVVPDSVPAIAKKRGRPPGKAGRPRVHGPEVEQQIIERLAAGETLQTICRGPGMPTPWAVNSWMGSGAGSRPGFRERYYAARECGAIALVEDCLDIVDAAGPESAHWAETRVKHRRWMAMKFCPSLFGDAGALRPATSVLVSSGYVAPPVAPSVEDWIEFARRQISTAHPKQIGSDSEDIFGSDSEDISAGTPPDV
ncbi:MAG: terminase small subunit-like protein [Acidobacteriaceae bacterium]